MALKEPVSIHGAFTEKLQVLRAIRYVFMNITLEPFVKIRGKYRTSKYMVERVCK